MRYEQGIAWVRRWDEVSEDGLGKDSRPGDAFRSDMPEWSTRVRASNTVFLMERIRRQL